MQKIQILFPDPMMRRLREVAAIEDRPISEIVRRAVEKVLQQSPVPPASNKNFPTFHGGGVQIPASKMKQAIYGEDE